MLASQLHPFLWPKHSHRWLVTLVSQDSECLSSVLIKWTPILLSSLYYTQQSHQTYPHLLQLLCSLACLFGSLSFQRTLG